MQKDKQELERLLRSLELAELIRQNKEQVLEQELPKPKALEAHLQELKQKGQLLTRAGRVDGRRAAGKRRAKKNASRKKKAARQARWRRSWNQRMLEQALNGSHYAYVSGRWKRKKREWLITEEEWMEHIQPAIPAGAVIELRRYDTSLATTLDNIVVYDTDGGAVLFDGKEWSMRQNGYML